MPKPTILTLYGTLGADPEPRSLPARSGSLHVYDPKTDQVIERRFEIPELNFLSYSVATGGTGDQPVRWVSCFDPEGEAFRLRQGNRVEIQGYFEDRSYGKGDKRRTVRQFVVVSAALAKGVRL